MVRTKARLIGGSSIASQCTQQENRHLNNAFSVLVKWNALQGCHKCSALLVAREQTTSTREGEQHASCRALIAIAPPWFCDKVGAGDVCRGHLIFIHVQAWVCNEKTKIKLPLIVTLCCFFCKRSMQTLFLKRQRRPVAYLWHISIDQRTEGTSQRRRFSCLVNWGCDGRAAN